jgi:hypothetical protein
MDEHADPVGHIFMFEGNDLAVAATASAAEAFIEPGLWT